MSIWGNAITLGGSGGGSGPSASDAILTVTVPTGSTVTATKGGTTLSPTMWVQAADNTLDCALFVIAQAQFDSVNPWTITATNGTDTASDTVIISTNKQYSVEISFDYYLFRADGVYRGEWSSKAWWNESGNNKYPPSLTINTTLNCGLTTGGSATVGTVLNSNPLPLNKDTISYTWNSCSRSGTTTEIVPSILTPYADSYTVVARGNKITTNTGTDSIDISALSTGNYFFGFRFYVAYGSASASISEVGLI